MTDPTPVLLVDLSSIGHPIWHVSQQEPDPNHTSQRTAAIVRQLAAEPSAHGDLLRCARQFPQGA